MPQAFPWGLVMSAPPAGHIARSLFSRRKAGAQRKPHLFAQTLEAQGTALSHLAQGEPSRNPSFQMPAKSELGSRPSWRPASGLLCFRVSVRSALRTGNLAKAALLLSGNHLIPISPRTILVLETVQLRKLEVTKEHILRARW